MKPRAYWRWRRGRRALRRRQPPYHVAPCGLRHGSTEIRYLPWPCDGPNCGMRNPEQRAWLDDVIEHRASKP